MSMSATLPVPAVSRRQTDVIETAAVAQLCLALLFVSGFILAIVATGDGTKAFEDRQSGTPLLQVISLACFGPAFLFLTLKIKPMLDTLRNGWAYVLLVGLAMGSTLWSVEPDVTFRRAVALVLSAVFVVFAAVWFDTKRFIRILAVVFAVLAVVSLLSAAIPGIGITPDGAHVGRWRGVFSNKNTFGLFTGVSCITFLVVGLLTPRGDVRRWIWGGLFAMTFVLLYLSNARTSLVGLVMALAGMGAGKFLFVPTGWMRRATLQLRALIVGGTAFTAVFILPAAAAVILALLGRNLTLTGRLKLWEYAVGIGVRRPWFGAGYKSFWVDKLTWDLRIRQQYWSEPGEITRLAGNGHNGYLDMWLELGAIGIALLVVMFIIAGYRANAYLARTKNPVFYWHIGIMAFAVSYYCTNSLILRHDELAWFVVAYAFMSLAAAKFVGPRGQPSMLEPVSDDDLEPPAQPAAS